VAAQNFDLRIAHGGSVSDLLMLLLRHSLVMTHTLPHAWYAALLALAVALYEFSARRAPTHQFLIPPHRHKESPTLSRAARSRFLKDCATADPEQHLAAQHQIKYNIPAATLDGVIVARSLAHSRALPVCDSMGVERERD
jgi:hypothetical protein